ncbi:AraC family transcriptional regulator [Paenibacillus phytohabitans]|uniref:AraC family transcriptional regulator n=1 Tax=Paenibacillus phytohabitans TaxID=2654978 RepID=UPI00300940F2
MDSYDRTEAVISYIESNILEIDYDEISRIACCPLGLYHRIFSYITGISIADYVRRRRLTLAAIELINGEQKVIDVAVKYGYNSQAAFSRAFKEHTGIPPSFVTHELNLRLYPRMSIQYINETYRIEKGKKTIVAKLANIEFVDFGSYTMVGKEIRAKTSEIGSFWKKSFEEGMYDPLIKMKEYLPEDIDEYVGFIKGYNDDDDSFNYVVGMFMKQDVPVPDGYVGYDVPKRTVAKAWIEGEENDIYNNAFLLTTEALKKHGYDIDLSSNYCWCEVYTDQRFGIPKSKGEKLLTLDIYMPCVKIH